MSWLTDLFNRNSSEEPVEPQIPEEPVQENQPEQIETTVQLQVLGEDHAWHDVDERTEDGTYRIVIFDNFISIADDTGADDGSEV